MMREFRFIFVIITFCFASLLVDRLKKNDKTVYFIRKLMNTYIVLSLVSWSCSQKSQLHQLQLFKCIFRCKNSAWISSPQVK